MKDYIIGIVIGVITTVIIIAPARCEAQTTYYYGPQGQSQGTATRSGNTTYYYGPQGQSAGIATQSGNTTYYYGPQGQSQGIATAPTYNYNPAPIPLINQQSLTPQYDSIFGR